MVYYARGTPVNDAAPPLDKSSLRKTMYERPILGIVCGTMRSMCGADAACLAMNYQSLSLRKIPLRRSHSRGARTRLWERCDTPPYTINYTQ